MRGEAVAPADHQADAVVLDHSATALLGHPHLAIMSRVTGTAPLTCSSVFLPELGDGLGRDDDICCYGSYEAENLVAGLAELQFPRDCDGSDDQPGLEVRQLMYSVTSGSDQGYTHCLRCGVASIMEQMLIDLSPLIVLLFN